MSRPTGLRRRTALGLGAAAAVALPTAACSGARTPWRFLTAQEASTLDAICERIIPADDAPGASQAGVVRYIDRQLVGFLRPLQPVYRRGLARIDNAASRATGQPFAALAAARQNEILRVFEQSDRDFFNLVAAHAMHGFYGSPRHGGNKEFASWAMLGVAARPVRGRR